MCGDVLEARSHACVTPHTTAWHSVRRVWSAPPTNRPFPTHPGQLDLRGNALGNDGAILIGRGLRQAENKGLAELDMGYNEIKDDGACALAQVGGGAAVSGGNSRRCCARATRVVQLCNSCA